jgi:hypothetical protein
MAWHMLQTNESGVTEASIFDGKMFRLRCKSENLKRHPKLRVDAKINYL